MRYTQDNRANDAQRRAEDQLAHEAQLDKEQRQRQYSEFCAQMERGKFMDALCEIDYLWLDSADFKTDDRFLILLALKEAGLEWQTYAQFEDYHAHLHICDQGEVWFVEKTNMPNPLAVRFEVVRNGRAVKFTYRLQANLFGRAFDLSEGNAWGFIVSLFKPLM